MTSSREPGSASRCRSSGGEVRRYLGTSRRPRPPGARTLRARRGTARSAIVRSGALLGRDQEMGAAVLLPAVFSGLAAEGALLSVGDRLDARGIHPERQEVFLGRVGPPVSQGEVVLRGPALVAVPFDEELDRTVSLQPFRVGGERGGGVVAEVGLVVFEEGVFQVPLRVDLGDVRRQNTTVHPSRRSAGRRRGGSGLRRPAGLLSRGLGPGGGRWGLLLARRYQTERSGEQQRENRRPCPVFHDCLLLVCS